MVLVSTHAIQFTGDGRVDGLLYAAASCQGRQVSLLVDPWKPARMWERVILTAEAAGLAPDVHLHRMPGRYGEWLRITFKDPDGRSGCLVRKRDRRIPPGMHPDFLYGVLEGLARTGRSRLRFSLPTMSLDALGRLGMTGTERLGFVEAEHLDDHLDEMLRWRKRVPAMKKRIRDKETERIIEEWLGDPE